MRVEGDCGSNSVVRPPAAEWPLSAARHDEVPDTFQHFNNKWADREWWWCSMGSVINFNDGLFSESSESVLHCGRDSTRKAERSLRRRCSAPLAFSLASLSCVFLPSELPWKPQIVYLWLLLLEVGLTSLPTSGTPRENKHNSFLSEMTGGAPPIRI